MPNLLKNNSFILFLFLISGGLISAFLQYEAVWDFINYHYFNAWAFINGRVGYDVLLAGLNSFFNPLADVPLYYMIEYLNDYPRIIYFIQGLWFGALWFVFYKICLMYLDVTTLRDKLVLILCLLIALSGYATFKQIGTSTNEVMLAFLVMSGLYLLLKELFEIKSGNWKTFVLSGFLFGSAMGLKLTAFIYCVVIGFCLIVFYKQVKFPIRNILLFTFSGLIGFLVFDGFWLWKMWQMFENPFFPFANRFFKSSWLSAHNFTDNNFTPKNWSDFALWPLIQSFSFQRDEGKMFVADMRPAVIYFIFIGSVFVWLAKGVKNKNFAINPKWGFLILFFLLTYVMWAAVFSIVRYYIVWEMLAAIFIVKAIFGFSPKSVIGEGLYYSFLLLLTFSLLSTAYFSDKWGRRYDYKKIPTKQDHYFWVDDNVLIPDNTLFIMFDLPSSALFVEYFKRNPTIRGINVMQGSYIAEYDDGRKFDYFNYHPKWLEEKRKIINGHEGMVFLITVRENVNNLDFSKEEIFDSYECKTLKNNMVPFAQICVPKKLSKVLFKKQGDSDNAENIR